MTQNNPQFSNAEVKRYLYNEMSDEEHAAMEEKFFENDELFFEIADTENRLVDLYAKGELAGEELQRFESSLNQLPKRRAKVANAVALQTFFDEERKEPIPVVVGQTFWQKLAEFFTIKTPAFGYALGGLLVLLTVGSAFLFLENRRQSNELARLQNAQNQSQKEIELENQLATAQRRESELQNQIDTERETSGDLTDELESEKTRRERIQSELERLRKERDKIPVPTPKPEQQTPIIASISLAPTIITRDLNPLGAKNLTVERGTKRLAVRLALPDNVKKEERFSVMFNGKTVAQNLAVRVSRNGEKSVQLTVSSSDLIDGVNKLILINAEGNQISSYLFKAEKK